MYLHIFPSPAFIFLPGKPAVGFAAKQLHRLRRKNRLAHKMACYYSSLRLPENAKRLPEKGISTFQVASLAYGSKQPRVNQNKAQGARLLSALPVLLHLPGHGTGDKAAYGFLRLCLNFPPMRQVLAVVHHL